MPGPDQCCPLCGEAFYIPNPDHFGDEDEGNENAFPEDTTEWLDEYRLVGRETGVESFWFRVDNDYHDFVPPENHSDVEGLFISELVDHVAGYEFGLDGADYLVYQSDDKGNVLFPIHDACIEIAKKILWDYNQANSISTPRASLQTLYDSLCKQHQKTVVKLPDPYWMYVFQWDHGYYSSGELQNHDEWDGHPGDEWFVTDPFNIPDLTSFISSLLPQRKSPSPASLKVGALQTDEMSSISTITSRIEELPIEILHEIRAYLPLSSVFALSSTSKTLESQLCLDQHFWRKGILSGILIPYVWDLDAKELSSKIGNSQNVSTEETGQSADDAQWDWKALAKLLLTEKDSIMMAEGEWSAAPKGFRNRCRIWKIVEEAMLL